MIGGLEFAGRYVSWIWDVVKAAVGQGTAEAFVEEQKQERYLNAFGGESVSIAGTIALQQAVPLQFAQVVTELVEPIGFGRKSKGGKDGLMDFFGGWTANGVTAVQQNLE